jgi:hypothetical protein
VIHVHSLTWTIAYNACNDDVYCPLSPTDVKWLIAAEVILNKLHFGNQLSENQSSSHRKVQYCCIRASDKMWW